MKIISAVSNKKQKRFLNYYFVLHIKFIALFQIFICEKEPLLKLILVCRHKQST